MRQSHQTHHDKSEQNPRFNDVPSNRHDMSEDPSAGSFSTPQSWQTSHSPANLDDLADIYQSQQAHQSSFQAPSSARIPRERPAHDPNRERSEELTYELQSR